MRLLPGLGHHRVEVGADGDHEVGLVPERAHLRHVRRRVNQTRMPGRDEPVRRVGEHERRHQPLGQLRHGLTGARLERAAARPDERPARALEQLQGATQMLLVGARHGGGGGQLGRVLLLRAGGEQVGRDLDVDGSRGRRQRHARRGRHHRPRVLRPGHAVGLLDDRGEHRGLVGRLVQHSAPDARAARARRDVRGDHEHRLARGPGLADGSERVGRARAGRGECDAEPPGRACVAVGRVGGRLLVAHAHEPDRRAVQLAPEREVVDARQPEGYLDARFLERRHCECGACQHARPG